VALVERVGDDALPTWRCADWTASTALTRVARRRTGLCVVLVGPDGERTMLPDAGANAGWSADLPPELFVSGGVLYVSGYTLLRDQSRRGAGGAAPGAGVGMKTVVDAASAAAARLPGFVVAAGDVDLMFANADEAVVLGPDHGARELVVKYARPAPRGPRA
jgi:sugar/nucleoside kinase (ribokinase family)